MKIVKFQNPRRGLDFCPSFDAHVWRTLKCDFIPAKIFIEKSSEQCFLRFYCSCQNHTLKFFNYTLNFGSKDMVLPCIEVKRFEESMFSCTWLLQYNRRLQW